MAKVKEINLTDDEALLLKNDGSAIRQFEGISYFVVIRTKSDIRIIWEICLILPTLRNLQTTMIYTHVASKNII